MKTVIKSSLILSSILLASCVNQNAKITDNLMPTTNPCGKLELLKKSYDDDFNQLKSVEVKGRVSNMWKAKLQLFGENCQVFTWGGTQHSYSCSLVAPDEEAAQQYYQNAKKTTQECLGDAWQLVETKRVHDEGMKASFTNTAAASKETVTFSTQLVPSSGLFSTTWSIYYYVGDMTEPKVSH